MDQTNADVKGKVVLVTGAGRGTPAPGVNFIVESATINILEEFAANTASAGIGQAMAAIFAEHGARALVLAALEANELKETEALIAAAHPDCAVLSRALNVTDEAQVARLVENAAAQFGSIDVLCSNAGIAPPLTRIGDSAPSAWWLGLEVNLKGCYLCARYVLPLMEKQRFGRIIFTSSIAAGLVEPRASSYQISKLAVTRLADCIDVEYGDANIRAFAVHPGRINTRLLRFVEGGGEADGAPASAASAALPDRPAEHDNVADLQNMCIFLVSEEAGFLSGRWVDATKKVDDLRREKGVITDKDLLRVEVSTGWADGGRVILPRDLV